MFHKKHNKTGNHGNKVWPTHTYHWYYVW